MYNLRWAVLVGGLLTLAGCNGKDGDTGSLTGDPVAGEAVFGDTCAVCHGADGAGMNNAPSLAVEVPDQTDAELEDIILNGYGDMAAQDLTDQEVADVIAYCRETFP